MKFDSFNQSAQDYVTFRTGSRRLAALEFAELLAALEAMYATIFVLILESEERGWLSLTASPFGEQHYADLRQLLSKRNPSPTLSTGHAMVGEVDMFMALDGIVEHTGVSIDVWHEERHRLRRTLRDLVGTLLPDATLTLKRAAFASPGSFSFAGLGEPIRELRELIKDLTFRNRQEKVKGDLKNDILKLKVEQLRLQQLEDRASLFLAMGAETVNLLELNGTLVNVRDSLEDRQSE